MASYFWKFVVPSSVIDSQGHVNNVSYVQWMQDIAIMHTKAIEADRLSEESNTMWVARSQEIEYLRQVFLGDELNVETYIEDVQRATSVRRYVFTNTKTSKIVARGRTNWVCLDKETGRPRSIPNEILTVFGFHSEPKKQSNELPAFGFEKSDS